MSRIKNGLYKRGNSWYIFVKVDGELIRKSFGQDKKAAELALAEIRKQRAVARAVDDWSGLESLLTPKVVLTFAEAAEKYLAERKHLKESTLRGYNEILKNYLLPAFGKRKIANITESDIADFKSLLATKVSAVRANNILGPLRYILKACSRRKLLAENPAVNIKAIPENPPDINPLTPEELERALKIMKAPHRRFFTCQAWTGARPSELLALRWKDVNFESNEIYIKRGRVRGHEGSPKTKSSVRTIPMFPIVREVLLELQKRPTQHVEGYVFLSKQGQPIDKHLDREWKLALEKAGIEHRPSYQLRHTFASICLQQGCDPGWLAGVLGHSTMQTTFRHYARYIKSASKESERRMEAFFAKQPKGYTKGYTDEDAAKQPQTETGSVCSFEEAKRKNGGGGENRTRVQRC